ncbi:MAG: autotransporter outer membrane beta-barrel domain-containing protein [Xanthobacteraceae bacterium]|nr:autotransporter outer membrane beta-barrel domain-containing protein [Xanthobacteraceae bacterium]
MKLFVTLTPSLVFRTALIGTALALVWLPTVASAQTGPPTPGVTDNAAQLSAAAGQLDLGSNFLQRLGREAAYGYVQRDNSGGGGASQSIAAPRYRSWYELYGQSAQTGPQGVFVGDKRKTIGGVAGIGMTVAPNLNLGVSVDQSHTDIDAPLALQTGNLDLTQIGVNGSYISGPWTLAFAAVHGFASIDSTRSTFGGPARANYRGSIDGGLGELSYYSAFDQSRIVPKVAIEYVTASTDAFRETGGTFPVSVASSQGDRARVLVGAEVGHYWIAGQQIFDVSAYGKFIDNFSQNIGSVDVSLGNASVAVQGVRESQQGADAGAGVSWLLSSTTRLYANYDGKYRSTFNSHQGTLGFEMRW